MANEQQPFEGQPLVVRLEHDGTGSASFDWTTVLMSLSGALATHVMAAIGRNAVVLGVRFLDRDGRETAGPAPAGITIIGFTTAT